jgi:glutamate-1-semialdehyde 2,1-aminomutase
VFLTGSYWNDPAPMAAALATLAIIERDNIPEKLAATGRRFVDGFLALGAKHGIPLAASGPPAMPYVRVADDPSFLRTQNLCAAAVAQGVFIHPHHNWFISAAMTDADIDDALQRLDRALATLAVGGSQVAQTSSLLGATSGAGEKQTGSLRYLQKSPVPPPRA